MRVDWRLTTVMYVPASSAPSAPGIGGAGVSTQHGADADQAWPQSSGEEDLQLQLALAMSKEEAEQVKPEQPIRTQGCPVAGKTFRPVLRAAVRGLRLTCRWS